MNRINWTVVVIVGIILIIVLFVVGLLGGWGYPGGGYRAWAMMGPGMMGGWGFSPFGGIGMLFMWLFPAGFIILTALGVAWLARNLGSPSLPPAGRACPNCGRGVQADWRHCPHCGTALN